MLTKTGRFALVTAMLWLAFGAGGRAVADLELSNPAGLTPGESFRFVFVTDGTTTATSSDINYYNNFVNTDASNEAGGGSNVFTTEVSPSRGPRSPRRPPFLR